MGKPLSQEPWRPCYRQESGQTAKTEWAREVVLLHRHRKPSGDTPTRLTLPRVRSIGVPLDHLPRHRQGHFRLCARRGHRVHFLHPRCHALL